MLLSLKIPTLQASSLQSPCKPFSKLCRTKICFLHPNSLPDEHSSESHSGFICTLSCDGNICGLFLYKPSGLSIKTHSATKSYFNCLKYNHICFSILNIKIPSFKIVFYYVKCEKGWLTTLYLSILYCRVKMK